MFGLNYWITVIIIFIGSYITNVWLKENNLKLKKKEPLSSKLAVYAWMFCPYLNFFLALCSVLSVGCIMFASDFTYQCMIKGGKYYSTVVSPQKTNLKKNSDEDFKVED